ncbi:MAG: hypothetical protein AB7O43_13070 [Hyphomicrobiaceae bacterium]
MSGSELPKRAASAWKCGWPHLAIGGVQIAGPRHNTLLYITFFHRFHFGMRIAVTNRKSTVT